MKKNLLHVISVSSRNIKVCTVKLYLFILVLACQVCFAKTKTIHVFVALCDNVNQGIVKVPDQLGNGQNARTNLYWGALYGFKTFFKRNAPEWQLVKKIKSKDSIVLEVLLYKHKTKDAYLLAEAYDGEYIDKCIDQFLLAANSRGTKSISLDSIQLDFGGDADLVAYAGHDGLMEFSTKVKFEPNDKEPMDVIILACYSKDFFYDEIKEACANPLLWTNHLMTPEAYTLHAAIKGWLSNETAEQIEKRSERAYDKYQKCGMSWAEDLFSSGFD